MVNSAKLGKLLKIIETPSPGCREPRITLQACRGNMRDHLNIREGGYRGGYGESWDAGSLDYRSLGAGSLEAWVRDH